MTSHKRKLFADYSKPDLHWLPSVYTVLLWWTSPDTKTAFSSSPVFLLRSSLASFPLLAVGVFSIVSRVGWFAVSGSVKHSKPHRRALAPITAKGNRRWTLSYNRYDENYFQTCPHTKNYVRSNGSEPGLTWWIQSSMCKVFTQLWKADKTVGNSF